MNHWLFSRKIDLLVLLLPVWLCWLVAFLLPASIIQAETSLWIWVVFVIGIDVSHVWSTLFRTYTDKEEFSNHRLLLILAPILCFVAAYLISAISFGLFWRCLAYMAVYHFIKQQYGFMRIYKAKGRDFRKKIFNDNWVIYISMLYPVLYWHLNLDRNFVWFIEGDFIQITVPQSILSVFNQIGTTAYVLLLLGWLIEEIIRGSQMIIGKVLWILTTAGNWFLGIVYFNSDFVFTITNVVAHGIPYLALVIFYQGRKETIRHRKRKIPVGLMVLISVLVLAFSEEFLWDMLVYRENIEFFASIWSYPLFNSSLELQHLALALLSVPQTTHYVLDGFIWKNNDKNPYLKPVLFK